MTERRMRSPQDLVRLDLRVTARPENDLVVRRAIEALDMPDTLIEDATLLGSELPRERGSGSAM